MRIVFFNRSFYPDTSATGQLLAELSEDLVKDYNCQVCVVAGMPLTHYIPYSSGAISGKIIQKEQFCGIEIIRVKNTGFSQKYFLGRISNYLTYFILSFFASFKLAKPDLVVAL